MPHPSYIGRSLDVLHSAVLTRRGTRLGPPSSLGEKSKATKASNEWSAYFAGCLIMPDDGKGATFKMGPAGALRFCAPSAHFGGYQATRPTRANPMASPSKGRPTWKAADGASLLSLFVSFLFSARDVLEISTTSLAHVHWHLQTSRNLNSQHHYHRLAPR